MPSPVTIVPGGSFATATGRPCQRHLMYLGANAQWLLWHLGGTSTLAAKASTDFATWTSPTGSSLTLARAHNGEGRNFAFSSFADTTSPGANYDLIHMSSAYRDSSTGATYAGRARYQHYNGVLSAGSSNDAAVGTADSSGTYGSYPAGNAIAITDDPRPIHGNPFGSNGALGGLQAGRGGFDSGGGLLYSSLPAWVGVASSANRVTSNAAFSLGSSAAVVICDNADTAGTFTNLRWAKYSGGWSAANSVLASAVASADTNAWGAVDRQPLDVHVVALSDNASNFVHRRFNGTSWSAGDSVPSLPGGYGVNSGILLATDGSGVRAYCFDASGNLMVTKWVSGSGWSAWAQELGGNGNARAYLTGHPYKAGTKYGLAWTESVGSGYDIVGLLVDSVTFTTVWSLDSAGAAEPASLRVRSAGADSAGAAELPRVASVVRARESAAQAAEAARMFVAGGDAAAWAELNLVAWLQVSLDSCAAADPASLSILPWDVESNSASERQRYAAAVGAGEALAAPEGSPWIGLAASGDSGSAGDGSLVSNFQVTVKIGSDVLAASEACSVAASVAAYEPVAARDLAGIRNYVTSADAGSEGDLYGTPYQFWPAFDQESLAFSDVGLVMAYPTSSESAAGSEAVRLAGSVRDSDARPSQFAPSVRIIVNRGDVFGVSDGARGRIAGSLGVLDAAGAVDVLIGVASLASGDAQAARDGLAGMWVVSSDVSAAVEPSSGRVTLRSGSRIAAGDLVQGRSTLVAREGYRVGDPPTADPTTAHFVGTTQVVIQGFRSPRLMTGGYFLGSTPDGRSGGRSEWIRARVYGQVSTAEAERMSLAGSIRSRDSGSEAERAGPRAVLAAMDAMAESEPGSYRFRFRSSGDSLATDQLRATESTAQIRLRSADSIGAASSRSLSALLRRSEAVACVDVPPIDNTALARLAANSIIVGGFGTGRRLVFQGYPFGVAGPSPASKASFVTAILAGVDGHRTSEDGYDWIDAFAAVGRDAFAFASIERIAARLSGADSGSAGDGRSVSARVTSREPASLADRSRIILAGASGDTSLVAFSMPEMTIGGSDASSAADGIGVSESTWTRASLVDRDVSFAIDLGMVSSLVISADTRSPAFADLGVASPGPTLVVWLDPYGASLADGEYVVPPVSVASQGNVPPGQATGGSGGQEMVLNYDAILVAATESDGPYFGSIADGGGDVSPEDAVLITDGRRRP